MLSQTCKAAMKAVVYLASRFDSDEKSAIREISEAIKESEHTVGKLLQTLARNNIVKSSKGPGGGFYLEHKQIKQPLMKVIEVIDGNSFFTNCGMGLGNCSEKQPCPLHNQYKKSRDNMHQIFSKNKIVDLCAQVDKGHAYLSR